MTDLHEAARLAPSDDEPEALRLWKQRFMHGRLKYAAAIAGSITALSAVMALTLSSDPGRFVHAVFLTANAAAMGALLVALRLAPRDRAGSAKMVAFALGVALGVAPATTVRFKSPFLQAGEVSAIGVVALTSIVVGLAFVVPVRWRLHVLAQVLIVGAYAAARFLVDAPHAASYGGVIGYVQVLTVGCIVATLSVLQSEKTQATEFYTQRRLERMNEESSKHSAELQQTLDALQAAQAELVRAERMASVATLVRGIAHELNNPIGFISGNMAPLRRYCDFLVRVAQQLSDGRPRSAEEVAELTRLTAQKDLAFVADDLSRMTGDIAEGARRAKLIISDLQGLTAAPQRGLEQVDLHRVVKQTVSLLAPRVPQGVRIETELQPVPKVVARAGQLEQVMVNLVDNAIRAVGDTGLIKVKVGQEATQVRLSVADNGPGMTPEVKERALEPFFTTRPPGEGSGLGLAIVASIVRGHKGTLVVESEKGRGTEILISLPAPA